MKIPLTIIVSLVLSNAVPANVAVSGIDFPEAQSIASVLKGVNMARGSQNVTLALDKSRKLRIIDSSQFHGLPVSFAIGIDGIRLPQVKTRLSRAQFIVRLKALVKFSKTGGHDKLYLVIHFDSDVSGAEGHKTLKDLCDCGVGGLIFQREETREERALRLARDRLPKPSSPK